MMSTIASPATMPITAASSQPGSRMNTRKSMAMPTVKKKMPSSRPLNGSTGGLDGLAHASVSAEHQSRNECPERHRQAGLVRGKPCADDDEQGRGDKQFRRMGARNHLEQRAHQQPSDQSEESDRQCSLRRPHWKCAPRRSRRRLRRAPRRQPEWEPLQDPVPAAPRSWHARRSWKAASQRTGARARSRWRTAQARAEDHGRHRSSVRRAARRRKSGRTSPAPAGRQGRTPGVASTTEAPEGQFEPESGTAGRRCRRLAIPSTVLRVRHCEPVQERKVTRPGSEPSPSGPRMAPAPR